MQVESRLNSANATTNNSTAGISARLAAARSNKTSEVQAEPPVTSTTTAVDASAQRTRELLRQRLERVKQGIIE